MAFVSLPPHRIAALRKRGSQGPSSSAAPRQSKTGTSPRFRSASRWPVFLASATAAASSADELADTVSFLGGAADPVAVVLLTLLVSFLALVFGELVPKRLALADPERWTLRAAGSDRAAGHGAGAGASGSRHARPTRCCSCSAPVAPPRTRAWRSKRLEHLIRMQRGLSREQREVIGETIAVGDRRIRSVLVPRTGRGRIYRRSSHCGCPSRRVGIRALALSGLRAGTSIRRLALSISRNLLERGRASSGTLAQAAPTVPETATVLATLRRLQGDRRKMAIVADEHGGVEGIVTVEDLVEELVGEIYDERDLRHPPVHVDAAGVLLRERQSCAARSGGLRRRTS